MSEKKVVVITGGGKGIGFGVASFFAENGYQVVITGRTEETLLHAKQELEKLYPTSVLSIVADGAEELQVQAAIQMVIDTYGRLDVLINNAQASASGLSLIEHSKKDFALAIDTGLYSTFYYMKEAYPYLKKCKGSVINFASGAGFSGKLGQSSYAAAKEAIRGLSRVAATEWGPVGINVNIVAPLVETEQLKNWKAKYRKLYEKTIQDIPMQRFGDAKKDIGAVCLFLASDGAKYITGETIAVQGGTGLRP